MTLFFDGRWDGGHGIGRMTREIRLRLSNIENFKIPSWPASPTNPIDPYIRGIELLAYPRSIFYSPGFNAPALGRARCVFTVCDLIHLRVVGEAGILKRAYYERLVKPALGQSFKVLTISEYSRSDVLNWSGVDPSKIVNVGCGVDDIFFNAAEPQSPGFPYLLYVGARKPHKNLDLLLKAYAASRAASELKLVLSGDPDAHLELLARQLGIADCIHYAGRIPEQALPGWYRGAAALLFPSLFEGFGLPPVEAMAGGTPTLVANATSLPEVVGDAALLVDPSSMESVVDGINQISYDSTLRERLRIAGPIQAKKHSWDAVASRVSSVLAELQASI